jgi:DNA-binding response OmpR family regulator
VANYTLLIADDEEAVLRTTELILRRAGYDVYSAANAGDASRLLGSQHFDLFLLDCIPDHRKLIREAKRSNPNLPVAVWTGDPAVSDLSQTDLVLHKPISPRALLATIANLLRGSKAA